MSIDAEALYDICTSESRFHVLHAIGQAWALVSSERDDGLALQVASMFLEEGEHVSGRKYPAPERGCR